MCLGFVKDSAPVPKVEEMAEQEFHEKQRAQDCSIHSLNNALGRKAVDSTQVLNEIKKRVHAYADVLKLPLTDKAVKKYRKTLSNGKTFFSAESVWYAAAALGQGRIPRQIEWLGTLTPAMIGASGLIVLGKTKDDTYHAVGARDGKIFDSLNKGEPHELTVENLNAIYSTILGVFEV